MVAAVRSISRNAVDSETARIQSRNEAIRRLTEGLPVSDLSGPPGETPEQRSERLWGMVPTRNETADPIGPRVGISEADLDLKVLDPDDLLNTPSAAAFQLPEDYTGPDPETLVDPNSIVDLLQERLGRYWYKAVEVRVGAPIESTGHHEIWILDKINGQAIEALEILFGQVENVTRIDLFTEEEMPSEGIGTNLEFVD